MQLVCQPNLLNRHSFSQQGIDELSEILTVQKNEGRWLPILPQKRRASGGSEFHSPLPLTFRAHLNDEGFWRGVRCAWLPREVEEGCGQTTPQSAPHSMAPQSARYEERECCGHNHEIEPRAVQAEIHDGNEEHRKQHAGSGGFAASI
jgi:hypothetical protein